MHPQPLRFAVIGAGMQGEYLARLIAEWADTEACLVKVCDLDEATARRVGEDLGVAWTTDFHQAAASDAVDAVLIAVPPGLHRDVTVVAARHGKHVFCEKPIAVELAHADEMIAACEEGGVILSTGYLFRYAENRDTLRRVLRDAVIGRPVLWREVLPPQTESQSWLSNYELGGGALFEYSHSIDFACYTLGRPQSVSAHLFSFREDPAWQTHDCYTCQIRFESGDVFHLSGLAFLPLNLDDAVKFGGSHREVRVNDIAGDRGAIYIGEDDHGGTGMFVSQHPGTERQQVERFPWTGWGGFAKHPGEAMIGEFLAAVRSGEPTRSCGREARGTLAVLQACLESSRTGQTVEL
jgi:predicted dehydrogenase